MPGLGLDRGRDAALEILIVLPPSLATRPRGADLLRDLGGAFLEPNMDGASVNLDVPDGPRPEGGEVPVYVQDRLRG